MVGVALAALAGVGFGLFQVSNSRAGRGVDSYVGTFVVLAVSVTALAAITLVTQDLDVLRRAPWQAYGWFALAGGVHFFFGWTFLTLSQRRLGASRTGVVTGTAPLFGTLIAFLVLGETVRSLAIVGVVMVVAGTISLARARAPAAEDGAIPPSWTVVFGLTAALCWGTSPVFIRWGLAELASPMIGVTVGLLAATLAYGVALAVRGAGPPRVLQRSTIRWLVLAGSFVAAAIAAQWAALSQAPVAAVLALSQLATPVVVVVAPLVSGEPAERLSLSGKIAAAVIVGGSLVIILARSAAS